MPVRCLAWLALSCWLAGCATPPPAPPPPELPLTAASQVALDRAIEASIEGASLPARAEAATRMAAWQQQVAQRTHDDFIDWFSGYWTQQWLAVKVGWYRLQSDNDPQQTADRLAAYLQDEYAGRVLAPVARQIDPQQVREAATQRYVRQLADDLARLPGRLGIPPGQVERRLREIPALPAPNGASLHALIHADPLPQLPAYVAWRQTLPPLGATGPGLDVARITPVARRASALLLDRLALSGASSAASALIGGVAGMALSLGTAGANLLLYQEEKKGLEASLRESLGEAVADLGHTLAHDPDYGVLAGVLALMRSLAENFPPTRVQPVDLPPPPDQAPWPEAASAP